MASVTFEDAQRTYPGSDVPAVDQLNLEIEDGEFMVLVGPSGCGKSTSLRMLAGLEEIDEGRILIGDRDVTDLRPKDRDIAMVFQNYALYPHMTVAENMAFALKMAGFGKEERVSRVRQAAKLLGLEEYLERKPKALSGGQRQRVAMGRAIVRSPQAFLMDEPLSNLDAKLRVSMRASLSQLHERLRVTTVYVTHDQIEAMTLGNRVAVLRDGRLQQVDTPQNLFDNPCNLFVAGFIGSPAMNMVEAKLVRDGGPGVVFGEYKLPIGAGVLESHPGLDRFFDRDVIVGVRPSDFEDASIAGDGGMPRINVHVDVTEELGSEVNVIFTINAPPVTHSDAQALAHDVGADEDEATFVAGEGQQLWTARVSPKTQARPGRNAELAVDTQGLHFFDPGSGEAIGFQPGRKTPQPGSQAEERA